MHQDIKKCMEKSNQRTTVTYGNRPFIQCIPSTSVSKIKNRRFDLKMTAVECRKILGVNKSTFLAWEQGKHKPNEVAGKRSSESRAERPSGRLRESFLHGFSIVGVSRSQVNPATRTHISPSGLT